MPQDAAPETPPGPEPSTARTPGAVTLIGTGHVLDIADAVRDAVVALRPDVVAVELDRARLQALVQRRAGAPPPQGGTWVQRRLQAFQEEVAASYGTRAGDEMLAAAEGGQRIGAQVALIDRDVQVTLRRAIKQLRWTERLRAVGMMVGGALRGLLPSRRSARDAVDEELANYSDDPDAALDELGRKFPTVRRVVIDERDTWMADRIRRIASTGRSVVAVVGDGHVPGLLRHLDGLDVTAHRLPDVRAGRLPRPDPDDTGSVSFSFQV